MGSISSNNDLHVLLFPFMSKGHTIPLLQLARILLDRHVAVTIVTTPANHQFMAESLAGTAASIVIIPFPGTNVPGIESTDKLPSMSLFDDFAMSTESMQPHFEQTLESLPRVSFMVTDMFLWWTLQSATKFGIPRFVYTGISCYGVSLYMEAGIQGIRSGTQPDDELVELTQFPWIRLSKEDFEPEFRNPESGSVVYEFNRKTMEATMKSKGILVNSFYELEPCFVDYLNSKLLTKSWCVGPFCLAEQPPKTCHQPPAGMKPQWIQWLDEKLEEKCSVLYVAFGSQAEISQEQLEEIAIGLEESTVNFLWVIRKKDWELPKGFEERVKQRGMVTREWVNQDQILKHDSVTGFLSHCGWNSVMESVCAEVPILAWPMMAEQHINARMVDEEIIVGLRVETSNGSVRGFVRREGVKKTVTELMDGERGKEARRKVSEWACMARKAMEEGGSSWSTLQTLLNYATSSSTCHNNNNDKV